MDTLQSGHKSQNSKAAYKQKKKKLTKEQVKILESSFTANKKLEPELKQQLANQLCVPPRQVAIWYQNKRARWKTQSLELEYNTLQVKLENTLADKRRLEKDLMHLQEELKKAQHQLSLVMNNQTRFSSDFFGINHTWSNQDGGSSSSLYNNDDMVSDDGQVLQFDELYASLVSGSLSSTKL